MATSTLLAISPLDGRYENQLSALQPLVSEFGLIRNRVRVELSWLLQLSDCTELKECPPSATLKALCDKIMQRFAESDAAGIKKIEQRTNHDVKAVEYWIADQLEANALSEYIPFIHFACTSEDINNLAYALMLVDCQALLHKAQQGVGQKLADMATKYASLAMLARTHGQTATPTTLGKEMRNIQHRLSLAIQQLSQQKITGKCNGAVGNYNAHCIAYPTINWPQLSEQFVRKLGLNWMPYSTQIESHDHLASWCHALMRVNTILIDASRDLWQYISMGYFVQSSNAEQVGSSTMPHKVNPIDFENAEGNLGIANALAGHCAAKLPISRLQRDLSDSTVLRNIGVIAGHSNLAYRSLSKGLAKLSANEAVIQQDLAHRWEVLAEAVQTVMRRYGISDAYEQLKKVSRGKQLTQQTLQDLIQQQPIPDECKQQLLTLKPEDYLGLAPSLALSE